MDFPIVQVTTTDGYTLHGILSTPGIESRSIIIHIHGSAGNCYQSNFYPQLFKMARNLKWAYLSTNNRGTGVYDIEMGTQSRGAAIEIFEECILDIDAWVEFALGLGYTNIILEGHSFGTNKVLYYVLNGKYKDRIKALILLGFTDSYGGQLEYLKTIHVDNEDLLEESRTLITQGNPLQLVSQPFVNWGELPQAAQSYLNFMSPNSQLSMVLPLKERGELRNFNRIRIPILGIVGDHNECTVIPPDEAVKLLNTQNKNASCHMIKDSDHTYRSKENELVKIVEDFITKIG